MYSQSIKTINLKKLDPHGSYTIADIQDYVLYIVKTYENISSNEESPILIYPNEIKN